MPDRMIAHENIPSSSIFPHSFQGGNHHEEDLSLVLALVICFGLTVAYAERDTYELSVNGMNGSVVSGGSLFVTAAGEKETKGGKDELTAKRVEYRRK